MSPRDGLVPILWGAILWALALLGVLAFGVDALPAALLAGAGGLAALWGLATAITGARDADTRSAGSGPASREREPEAASGPERGSVATIGLAAAIPLMLTGLVGAGQVFTAVGLALLVLSLASLAGEGGA